MKIKLDERRFHGNFVKNRECKFRTPETIPRKNVLIGKEFLFLLIDLTKEILDNFTV